MRLVMLAALSITAALALWVTHRHFAERDAERAQVLANTFRFTGKTTSRLDAWLPVHRPDARASWRTEPPGPFDSAVTVTLELDGAPHRFRVDPAKRTVQPIGAAAERLVKELRTSLTK